MSRGFKIFLLFILNLNAFGQVAVLDSITMEPLPFATVYNISDPTIMTTTDINGIFYLTKAAVGDSVRITYVGYNDLRTIYDPMQKVIKMASRDNSLEEVIIKASDDPAINIIKKVLRNRDKLSIVDISYYQCRVYTKNTIGFDTRSDSVRISNFISDNKFPATFFIAESMVERQYENRDKVFERVLASSVAGVKNPPFAILPEDAQSLHFYRDYLLIYNKEYLNPISQLSWVKYSFNLDNIYEENGDTLYQIYFRPKSDRYNCFKGMMIISNKGWAVQKITLRNGTSELYPFKLNQEYHQVSGQWFPYKFTTELRFPSAVGKDVPFLMTQVSLFDSIRFEKKPLEARYQNKTVLDENKAHSLEGLRTIALSAEDSTAYIFGAYIVQQTPVGYIIRNMEYFLKYQLPLGIFSIDLRSLYRTNLHERHRVGLGIVSDIKKMPHLDVGGYFAYGTNDKAWKFGGTVAWHFDKLRTKSIRYEYRDDVAGMNLFRFRNAWYNKYYSNFYHKTRAHTASLTYQAQPWTLSASYSLDNILPFYEYNPEISGIDKNRGMQLNETNINLQYFNGRQINFYNTWYVVRNIAYPIITVMYNAGLKGLPDGDFEYHKAELFINKIFRWNLFGRTNITLQGGKTWGLAPVFRLFSAPASLTGKLTLQVPYSFQTMTPNIYWADDYVHIFAEQSFGKLFVTKFSTPELFLAYNGGWAKLHKGGIHVPIILKDYPGGYHEVGGGFNSLIRIPIYDWFAFGINAGAYYRLTDKQPLKFGENFVLKLGVGFLF